MRGARFLSSSDQTSAPGVTAPGAFFLDGNKHRKMPHMKTLTWPINMVARVADVDSRILSQWFRTGMLQHRGDDKHSMGTGVKVGLSRPRVIEATIVRLLSRYGVPASRAGRAAFEFTINENAGRPVCELFQTGTTALVIRQHDAVVVNLTPETRISDLSANAVAIVVDLNAIVAHVDAELSKPNQRKRKNRNDYRTDSYLTQTN
jgi:hypothetical protein